MGRVGAGVMVATDVPAQSLDKVVPDKEDSGEPPLPHQSDLIGTPKLTRPRRGRFPGEIILIK